MELLAYIGFFKKLKNTTFVIIVLSLENI